MHSSSYPKQSLNKTLEMTRRIDEEELIAIDQVLATLPTVDAKISILTSALGQDRWEKQTILNAANTPYYALLAFQRNLLQRDQFATFLLYHSAVMQHGIENVSTCLLFKKDAIHHEHRELIKTTLKKIDIGLVLQTSDWTEDEWAKVGQDMKELIGSQMSEEEFKSFFNQIQNSSSTDIADDELDEFYQEMKKLPASEQRFFLISHADEEKNSVADRLEALRFYVFGRVDNRRMIPSLGMMQAYLKVKFKKQACEINPVIGLSSLEDIKKNGRSNQRDMAIPFPQVKLPEEADSFHAPFYLFPYHDFYHAFMASTLPTNHRELMVNIGEELDQDVLEKNAPYLAINDYFPKKIAKIIQSYAEDMNDEIVRVMAGSFIDMEHSAYRFRHWLVSGYPELFWQAVHSIFLKVGLIPLVNTSYEEIPSVTEATTYSRVLSKIYSVTDKTDPEIADAPKMGFAKLLQSYSSRHNKLILQSAGTAPLLSSLESSYRAMSHHWQKVHALDLIEELQANLEKRKAHPENAIQLDQIIENSLLKLKKLIDLCNVTDMFIKANHYRIRQLQQACMIFMSKNLKVLVHEPLFQKLQRNDPKQVKAFMLQVQKSRFFRDIFKFACEDKEAENLHKLIFLSDVNQLDTYGYTPLDYAIQMGNENWVNKLLDKGASVHPQEKSKALPSLFSAIYHGHGKLFNLLRCRGFNMEHRYQNQSWLEFYSACLADSKTYAGMVKKFYAGMKRDGKYKFTDPNEAITFSQASALNRKTFKQNEINLANLSGAPMQQVGEKLYEIIAENISWGCKRAEPSLLYKTQARS